MKKFLVSMVAVLAATSAFAADPIFGAKPPVKKAGVDFTSQSVGVQLQDNKFFVNYANDGKDWFTITNPGKVVPNVENYAGGLFKGTRFVSVVATNGVAGSEVLLSTNSGNCIATVTIKPDEWVGVGEWMWDNRENFTALSVLPFSDHSYMQAPFEDIDEAQYNEMVSHLHKIDLTMLKMYK